MQIFASAEVTSLPQVRYALEPPAQQPHDAATQRHAMVRCLLADIWKVEHDLTVKRAIATATNNTLDALKPLLRATGKLDSFQDELEQLFTRAADLWKRTMKYRIRVFASLDFGDFKEALGYPENGVGPLTPEEAAYKNHRIPSIIVFPRILATRDNTSIHRGVILDGDQPLSIKAYSDALRQNSRLGSMNGDGTRKRVRRQTDSGSLPSGQALDPALREMAQVRMINGTAPGV